VYDSRDKVVEAFDKSRGQAVLHEATDPRALFQEASRQPLEWSQPACLRHGAPVGQCTLRPTLAAVAEERPELLLERVCLGQRFVGREQFREFRRPVRIELVLVGKHQEALAFQNLPFRLVCLAAKASADFIDGLVDVGNEVEAVVNNVCVRLPGLDGRLVRTRTVDTPQGPWSSGQTQPVSISPIDAETDLIKVRSTIPMHLQSQEFILLMVEGI
jgi:hypothetical protein